MMRGRSAGIERFPDAPWGCSAPRAITLHALDGLALCSALTGCSAMTAPKVATYRHPATGEVGRCEIPNDWTRSFRPVWQYVAVREAYVVCNNGAERLGFVRVLRAHVASGCQGRSRTTPVSRGRAPQNDGPDTSRISIDERRRSSTRSSRA